MRAENDSFWSWFISRRSFCQDRLGTNVGKVEGKGIFCRLVAHYHAELLRRKPDLEYSLEQLLDEVNKRWSF